MRDNNFTHNSHQFDTVALMHGILNIYEGKVMALCLFLALCMLELMFQLERLVCLLLGYFTKMVCFLDSNLTLNQAKLLTI